MKWLVLFSILTTAAFSHDIYQKHLPSNIYEQIIQKKLVNENDMRTITEVKYDEVADTIAISVERKHGEYVLVDYWCGQVVDDFRGMQVAYHKGKVIVHVIFDGMGRDYLAYPPFSKQDEKGITLSILDLIEGGYMKLVENSKTE
jgi:hypothetical protein